MPFSRPATFNTIHELIKSFPYLERSETIELFRHVRKLKGLIDLPTLKVICYFKTPRSKSKVSKNRASDVQRIFTELKKLKGDRERCAKLRELKGVHTPTASTILMFMSPNKYPVIDIRVWKVLADFDLVNAKRRWRGFSEQDWEDYLFVMRRLAKRHKVSPRHIDKVLYSYHVLQYELTSE